MTAVSCLAAGYALRALVGIVQSEPDADPEPETDVEQEPVDPVLVPVREVADPAAPRDPGLRPQAMR